MCQSKRFGQGGVMVVEVWMNDVQVAALYGSAAEDVVALCRKNGKVRFQWGRDEFCVVTSGSA